MVTVSDSLRQMMADARREGVKLDVFDGARLHLDRIVVPASARGDGIGSRYLGRLVAYADRVGKVVTLTPSSDHGGNVARLVRFYEGFGFRKNKGRARDLEISEEMYRLPASALGGATVAGGAKVVATRAVEEDGLQADVFTDTRPGFQVRVWDVDSGNTLPGGIHLGFKTLREAVAFAEKSLGIKSSGYAGYDVPEERVFLGARASQVCASKVAELSHLALDVCVTRSTGPEGPKIGGGDDVLSAVAKIAPDILTDVREHFLVLYLNTKYRVIGAYRAAVGGVNSQLVDQRMVFGPALMLGAFAVIFVHNHPSGDPAPSVSDMQLTERFKNSAMQLGVRALDHVVVGTSQQAPTQGRHVYHSLVEHGEMTPTKGDS